MRQIQPTPTSQSKSIHNFRMFSVTSICDIEVLPSLRRILCCSRATIYRTIKKAKIPIYYIPGKRSQVLIQSASLWRLAITPAYKKHIQRLGIELLGKRQLQQFKLKYGKSSLCIAIESGILPISLPLAISAIECGLIPVDKDYNFPEWFSLYLNGKLTLNLPTKA